MVWERKRGLTNIFDIFVELMDYHENRKGESKNVFYSISIDYLQFFLYYSLMERNVKNVMKKNGKTVTLDKENIDVAFLHGGFMYETDSSQIEIIKKCIKPKHIILMHIHPKYTEHFVNVANALKEEFPSVTIFNKPMEKKIFYIK